MPKFLFNKPSLKILQAPQLNNLFPLKSPRKIEKLVKNVAFFLSSLLLVFVFSSVFVPNCRAQSFASWLEEFLRQNQAPPQEQSPQEALAVAHEKSQAARETLEKYRSQEFAESFRQASIPESRLSELITAKQEEVQTWESAIANIRELNNLLATPEPTPQQAPPTPQEAAELERKLDRLREFKLKLQLEKDSIQTLSEQNRQNLRFLQQELAEAQRELEGAAETTARSQAQSRQELAFAKIGAAEAANFLYRWHIRRLERQLFLVNSEINTTNSVLEKSGLLNVLDASRANRELEGILKQLPEIQKSVEKASNTVNHINEKIHKIQIDNSTSSIPPQIPESIKIELEIWNSLFTTRRAKLALLKLEEDFWRKILSLQGQPTLQQMRDLHTETKNAQKTVSAFLGVLDSRITEAQARAEQLRDRSNLPSTQPSEKKSLLNLLPLNQDLLEELLQAKNRALEATALLTRAISGLDTRIAEQTSKQSLLAFLNQISHFLEQTLNFPLWQSETKTLTLGIALSAILAILLSIYLAKIVSRRVSVVLGRRFKIPYSQRHLYETLLLYALSLLLTLTVLQWLEIPLTVFAFLGGALMVGIGFGSQNLINNFISGLLLLFEQNIKAGDLIEIEGRTGRVIQFGNRCITIRTFDGVELLIPNSLLLEKTVINWTLTDFVHRYEISIGVLYGTNPEFVLKLLKEILTSHPDVLKAPPPEVALENFGPTSLEFRLYYWLQVGTHDARKVGTELRIAILREFEKHGIEIPHPYRVPPSQQPTPPSPPQKT